MSTGRQAAAPGASQDAIASCLIRGLADAVGSVYGERFSRLVAVDTRSWRRSEGRVSNRANA